VHVVAHRILIFGAHPDDAEFHAGGLIARHCRRGSVVRLVSVTDGSAGHHRLGRDALRERRCAEAQAAAQRLGCEVKVWDNADGELTPTLTVRRQVIAEMRSFDPDLVLTHRIHDYHPDHRATGELVRDACYMVRVPSVVPNERALPRDPIVASMWDQFTRPAPFSCDVVVPVDDVFDAAVDALDCHASQVYEWIPHTLGAEQRVPSDDRARREWLGQFVGRRPAGIAKRCRAQLIALLGEARGSAVRYAEAYEISEYARKPTPEEIANLFPIE
jgi:LmbE family N-acetylglucosaminyl deacetylase